jgi:sterol desaturase/sphingolipid hydroxylase (fatty acid hydroxylase superfamily)
MSRQNDAVVDQRGDWKPSDTIKPSPLFAWPIQPFATVKWLLLYPGYLLPWTMFYAALSVVTWLYLTPDMSTMKTFGPRWIAYIFARNLLSVVLAISAWHIRLYVRRAQGANYKYNSRWPAKGKANFLFRDQILENIFWTVVSAVPIWTAYEVLTLWAFANGLIPFVDWRSHPVYCTLLLIAIPLIHEFHFYWIHRLIHWPPLYRTIHYLHHKNVNPGPWSGLSMHPIEHVLYFSGVLIHWLLPSHPLHAIFHLQALGFLPAQGHVGFERVVIKDGVSVQTGDYGHYLHHKFFECNYCSELMPLDKLFGTFHDGSKEAEEVMYKRFRARRQQASGS